MVATWSLFIPACHSIKRAIYSSGVSPPSWIGRGCAADISSGLWTATSGGWSARGGGVCGVVEFWDDVE